MKNQKMLRPLINGAFLLSCLALLSACDWLKKGSGCPTCDSSSSLASAAPEDVLLSVDGKPAITKGSFDDFFNAYLSSNPQAAAYIAFDPGARRRVFQEKELQVLVAHKVKKDGKDKTPEYRKKFEQACEMAQWSVNLEIFRDEVLASIDSSDAGLEKFYNENKGKNPAFDNAPFQISPEGIKMQGVEFSDQKAARDFLTKAQKAPGEFSALAKAAKNSVKDLGLITTASSDFGLKAKAKTLQSNGVDLVYTPKGKYLVIKGVGQRQAPKYAEFAELVKDAQGKEMLSNVKKQVEFPQIVMKRIEDLKKELNAKENLKYFEDEEAKKKAELDAKMKELQATEDKEETTKQESKEPVQEAAVAA